jgi:hypothetical protein
VAPDRDPAGQLARGFGDFAGSGQGGDGLGMRGAQQPDPAVGGRGDPVPLVFLGGQALPGLRGNSSLEGSIVGAQESRARTYFAITTNP